MAYNFLIAKTAKQSNSESITVIIIDYLPGLGFLASSVPLPYQRVSPRQRR